MRILVQKFGGTSVANLECMLKVREKVLAALDKGYKVVVVLSAMSGETNRLIDMAKKWSSKPDPAEMDVLLATGEQTSVALFSMLLKDKGVKTRSLLGYQIPIQTDKSFGKARILDIDAEKLKHMLTRFDVLVAAGFQGCDCEQRITTLGRGGSDTSAVALAAALNAELCEIYTDVDGVYTTDPNICSKARKIHKIAYDEMLEMASMGAKVLQIRSVEFAKKYNVPVHVRSTFSDEPGTLVVQEDETMEAAMVSGIAYDKDQARITLVDVYDEPGIAATVFEPLAAANIVVDMIVQNPSREGRTDMTFTVPKGSLEETLDIIEKIKDQIGARGVLSDPNVAKVSVIGVGMRNHSGVAAIAFSALKNENINIMIISTSEIKISCLIEEKYTELAVRTLHEAFGLDQA
ncbi:aspartate kinase [Desulfohalobiaceae bacterium Ax17]|uniref:aspartate kinase n=1 Tax=Desulfovulcanus ferrireducens TaxID=2831190 RepID=UPI00207BA584|nr:aspartate kinase [Desulfovulcanus ferrireducens]MBT8762442.1 aspartate kinase [Desulfovulcanus ferrireducens]